MNLTLFMTLSHRLTPFNPVCSESQLPWTFCLLMSCPFPTSHFLNKSSDLTEKYTTTCPISIPPCFSTDVYMYINTESSSSAQLPVCELVRTNLTSYSTSRRLSSLLLFGSGSGSVDLENRCQELGQPCGLGHSSCSIPPLGV